MKRIVSSDLRSLDRRTRVIALAVAIFLAGLLATAASLDPSESGFGTHTQLGLSECFVRRNWGIRCPSCGMTTAWAHLMRGSIGDSVGASAGGFLLGVTALIALPWLLASSLLGRWCYLRPSSSLVFPFVAVLLLVLSLDWTRRTGWPLFLEPIIESIFLGKLPASDTFHFLFL